MVGLDLLSLVWAVSGKFALNELVKVLLAFSAALLLLIFSPGDRKQAGRNMAVSISGAMAIASFLSIDTLSTRVFSSLFFHLIEGDSYAFLDFEAVDSSLRMSSIFLNSNAFAGCTGIAILLGLSLLVSSSSRRGRMLHGVCLCVNSVAFLLALSRGAMAVIAAAFLVYLILERPQRRGKLLLIMILTLILAGGAALLSSASGALDEWTGVNWVPLLSGLAAGLILGGFVYTLDAISARLPKFTLSKRSSFVSLAVLGVVVVAGAALLFAAFRMDKEPLVVDSYVSRAFYPQPGDYTVTIQADGEMRIYILSQTKQEAATNQYSALYNEELTQHSGTMQIPISVPEGTIAVYLMADGGQGEAVISSASYDGASGSGTIPLGYTLLPESIASRMQGALQSHSFQLRLLYFEDGLKLFQKSPLWGLGIGAVENSLPSVQTYSYEVKYVHNHYIQAMAETGLLGLLCFAGLLGSSAWCILRDRRKEDGHPLTAALGAVLLFMAGHAAVEINFSFYAFLPVGYAAFALIGLCCGEGMKLPGGVKKWQNGTLALSCAVSIVFALLLGLNLYARNLVTAPGASLNDVVTAASIDPFESADYKLSYVVSVQEVYASQPELAAQADRYAEELARLDSNSIPPYLMEFYFRTGQESQALQMAVKYLNFVPSFQDAWDSVFSLLETYQSGSDEFNATVLELEQLREQWNAEHLSTITLDEGATALIERCGGQSTATEE